MPLPPPPSEPRDTQQPSSLPPPPPTADATSREVCYRHPDRTVGRRCTRCGKPACADCLEQVSVGSHCRDCIKAARPDIKTRARYWQASKPAIVSYVLIGINVAVFVGLGLWYDLGGMLAGDITEAHVEYALFDSWRTGIIETSQGPFLVGEPNEWYRLVTAGFLHFGLIHLAFNMYFLFVLGNQMEPQLGRVKFLLLYAASLLGGSAGVMVINQGSFTAGASGAVFGLLGAMAVGIWLHGINPFSTQIGTLLLINLGLTFFVGGISIGGHVGGLLAGATCGFVMMAPGYKAYPAWARYATPVAVSVLSVVVAVLATS